jgi:hypothetical protein
MNQLYSTVSEGVCRDTICALIHNPPCAYIDFATYPLPSMENRLMIRVEAGEKAYRDPERHMHSNQGAIVDD